MSKQLYPVLVAFLLAARIAVSFHFDDGKVRGDPVVYTTMLVNLVDHHKLFAIFVPGASTEPLEFKDFLTKVRQTISPTRFFVDYQWFGVLVYLPAILLGSSKIVLLINNLFYFLVGLLVLRSIPTRMSELQLIILWVVYLFFPLSFLFLTPRLETEMPFVFLLFVAWNMFFSLKRPSIIGALVLLIALSLTRPLGFVFAATLLMWSAVGKDYRSVFVASLSIVAAVAANNIVKGNSLEGNSINTYMNESPALIFYCSNTTNGNGDLDYVTQSEISSRDSNLVKFSDGRMSSVGLVAEVFMQNLRSPGVFLRNSFYKTGAYFFNYWPSSWAMGRNTPPQSAAKALMQVSFNLLMIIALVYSVLRFRPKDAQFYAIFFGLSYLYHMAFLARYRYFVPVFYLGFPSLLYFVSHVAENSIKGLRARLHPHETPEENMKKDSSA